MIIDRTLKAGLFGYFTEFWLQIQQDLLTSLCWTDPKTPFSTKERKKWKCLWKQQKKLLKNCFSIRRFAHPRGSMAVFKITMKLTKDVLLRLLPNLKHLDQHEVCSHLPALFPPMINKFHNGSASLDKMSRRSSSQSARQKFSKIFSWEVSA